MLAEDAAHRKAIQKHLRSDCIPTAVYYPIPLHLQTAYRDLSGKPGDFPVTQDCAGCILSLPMHPYLTAADQDRIITGVNGA